MNIFDPLISGSLSVSGSAEISNNLSVNGTISGDGSGITGIPASGVTGLNLSQITDGSATASISSADGFRVNSDVEVTGSIKVNDIVIGNDNVVTITVSDLDGKYYIDGVKNPVLTFVKGFTYKFLYPNIGSHPLRFSTTSDGTHNGGVEYTDGVTTSASPDAYVQIVVTDSTPTTLYYFCTVHQNMGNSISVLSEILNVTSDRNVVYIEPSRIATTGSNVFEGDQVITGSVEVTGSITLNGQPIGTGKLDETTFNDYTSSNDDRVDSLESTSGSHNDRLDLIEISTGSLNQFTSSIDSTIKGKLDNENVVSGSEQIDITQTSGYTSFSSSIATTDLTQENRLDSLETESGSIRGDFNDYTSSNDDRLDSLETESGSIRTDFNSYTSSNNDKIGSLETESGSIRDDFNSYTSSNDTTIGLLESTSGSHNDRLDAIETSTSSLNQFTSSIDTTIKTKLDFEDVISGSIQVDITGTTGYGTFSSSIDTSISSSVSDLSSSVVNYNDVQDGRLDTIESNYVTTGSNSFLGDQTITGSLTITNNFTVLGSSSLLFVTTSQLAVSASVISVNVFEPAERFGGLKVYDSGSESHQATASLLWDSLHNHWVYQNVSGSNYSGGMFLSGPRNTGSLGDEPGLTSGKIAKSIGGDHLDNSIMNEDGSTIHITGSLSATGTVYGTNITAIETSTSSLNSYTSSLKAAIELTGSNLTVKGDLLVKGTTTNVNTTTLNVDNNLITLNGTGATSAGIRINDTTGPNLVSGSLLWDATNDYWIAGQLGSEQRIIRETEFSNLSTKVGNLETASGSIRTDFNSYTSSNDSTNTTQNSRLTSLESATGSYTTTDYYVTGATWGSSTGVITLTRNDGNTVTVDVDGRYAYYAHQTSTNSDFNNVRESGIYTLDYGGQANANSPDDLAWHALWHARSGGTRQAQITIPYSQDNIYYRRADNATGEAWNSWVRIWDTEDFSSTQVSNWDTAYGWGDHGTVGYLTGETDTLATVTSRGASTTNKITIEAGGTANSPLLRLNATNAISFVHGLELMASGLTSNQSIILPIGVAGSTKNAGYIGYKYSGTAASNDNLLSLGHWGSDHLLTINGVGNVTITGTITASGYNNGNWDTAFGWGDHALAGYLTSYSESDTLATVVARGNTTTSEIVVGAITVTGSLSRGTYTTGSNYVTGADNIVLKGNGSGVSGIFFESEKNGTNINHPSDFGFIQFHPYGIGGSTGESNRLVIGVSNDADDMIVLNPVDANGVKVRVGTGTTEYTVWHSGNLTNLNQLTNGPGYITGNQTITISGDASGSGTTSIGLTVDKIDGVAFRNTGSNSGVNANSLDSNGMTYVTNVDGNNANLSGNSTDGALYSQVYSSSWQHQIYGDYRTGEIYVRGKNNNSWQSWKRVALSSATTFSNVTSVTFTHNLGTEYVTAQVFDTSGNMFFPSNIQITSTQVIVTFATNRSGRLVVTG